MGSSMALIDGASSSFENSPESCFKENLPMYENKSQNFTYAEADYRHKNTKPHHSCICKYLHYLVSYVTHSTVDESHNPNFLFYSDIYMLLRKLAFHKLSEY